MVIKRYASLMFFRVEDHLQSIYNKMQQGIIQEIIYIQEENK